MDLQPVIRKLQSTVDCARGTGQRKHKNEARDLWRRIYESRSEGKPGLSGAITSRVLVMPLACLYALLASSGLWMCTTLLGTWV
ncbi:MAG: hypothetical protein JO217_12610 [Acidobacteriaceae bacterium]|nr:hypothetical protein [Acidobacteriaceae bacterium]